jgi:NADH-quinone oxidoreductase subunit M
LAALYMLIVYQRTMTGPTVESVKQVKDLQPREVVAIVPLVVLLLGLGLFPKPVLDVISPAVHDTMQTVGVTDPKPVQPVAEESSR